MIPDFGFGKSKGGRKKLWRRKLASEMKLSENRRRGISMLASNGNGETGIAGSETRNCSPPCLAPVLRSGCHGSKGKSTDFHGCEMPFSGDESLGLALIDVHCCFPTKQRLLQPEHQVSFSPVALQYESPTTVIRLPPHQKRWTAR